MKPIAGPGGILVVVGMTREAKILGPDAPVLIGGGDSLALAAALEAELAAGVAGVVSFGLCGALDPSLKVGDLEFDLLSRSVVRSGKRIELLAQELKILEYLMRHAGEVVTRTMLLEKVWDFHFDPKTNIVETHISRLRAKIDKGFDPPLLHTVRGAGYVVRGAD